MHVLYDTRTVHPLDRYEYARTGAAGEFAPVAIHGPAPVDLLAAMSVAQIGDFKVETATWAADSEIVARRTDRLIRAGDPECYRIYLSVNGGVRMEQADNRVPFRVRDIALYDLSRPWQTTHTTGPAPMHVVMLTFPRALVPIAHATVRPLVGTLMPRNLPGRSLIAQFLIELIDPASAADLEGDPSVADVLREGMVGLIRQRLGQPNGITPYTKKLLHVANIRRIIRRCHADPALDPDRIAQAANISVRYLHKIFQGAELTPMQLLKRLRLEECQRDLQDPTRATMYIKDIVAKHGYLRLDQFARDFKQLFGISATRHVGSPASGQPDARSEP